MFELPAVLPQDTSQVASKFNARSSFRSMEIEEIQQIANKTHSCPEFPKFVEKITRKAYLKEVQDVEEYIGLVSHTVYGADGSIVGDTFSESHANAGEIRVRPKQLREHQTEDITSQLKSMSGSVMQAVAWSHGLDMLPRNTSKPEVYMDSLATQKFVHDSQSSASKALGTESFKVLTRSNYRAPFGLKYSKYDDHWTNRMYLRRRSLQTLITIMYICLERRDYERAWRALTSVMREKHVDVRFLWRPALELLAWHKLAKPDSKSPDDFLNWLILNFPKLPQTKAHMHRSRPNSFVFMPVSIMIKMADNKFAEAFAQVDQALNSAQYANNATCWALCGLAHLKLGHDNAAVVRCFQKCLELGGTIPKKLRKQVRLDTEESSDESETSKEDSSETEASESEKEDLEGNVETYSSQPFYSQATTLGAELGSSDSDDDDMI